MPQDALDTARTLNLLIADAVATLGEVARVHVLRVAEVMEENARMWLENGDSGLADLRR